MIYMFLSELTKTWNETWTISHVLCMISRLPCDNSCVVYNSLWSQALEPDILTSAVVFFHVFRVILGCRKGTLSAVVGLTPWQTKGSGKNKQKNSEIIFLGPRSEQVDFAFNQAVSFFWKVIGRCVDDELFQNQTHSNPVSDFSRQIYSFCGTQNGRCKCSFWKKQLAARFLITLPPSATSDSVKVQNGLRSISKNTNTTPKLTPSTENVNTSLCVL